MSHMERRAGVERRARHLIPEGLERKAERRESERRDSPRRAVAMDVREPGCRARSCVGDLSVDGAAFVTLAPPTGDEVELLVSIPTYVGPIMARAQVVGRRPAARGVQVSVAFTDLDVEAQLAIAQWLEPS